MSEKKVSKKSSKKDKVLEQEYNQDNLNRKIEKLEIQNKELENQHARALADYQNLEKRTLENELRYREFANEEIIKELLEVVDDLGSSLEHANDDTDGIHKVYKKLVRILENYGVEEIDNVGCFNPDVHEAIENTEGEKDKIIRVYRKGYLYKGKLLRPTMVAVGSG